MHFNVLDLYRLLIIDESGLPWLLNFTPLLRHVEVEHQAHQGTLQHFFVLSQLDSSAGVMTGAIKRK